MTEKEPEDEDSDVDGDVDVDEICASLVIGRAAPERKRQRSGLDDDDGGVLDEGTRTKIVAFDELVRASRPSGEGQVVPFNEIMFWSQGLVGMTPMDAVNGNRHKELAVLISLDPSQINRKALAETGRGLSGGLTLLQTAVLLGHFKCARVLIKAGAIGAVDILDRTDSMLRLDVMPYIIDGGSRQELRAMELKRLHGEKAPIGRLLLRALREATYFTRQETADEKKKIDARNARYRATFKLWVDTVGADDFRDVHGQSLQDDAAAMHEWTIFYALQRRALLTFLAVHRWSRDVNPEFCRIHRDVIWHKIVPHLFAPTYCHQCKRGMKFRLVCAGCRITLIPCDYCRGDYRRDENYRYPFPACEACKGFVCQDCVQQCLARPVMDACRAVFCTRCAPTTCEECLYHQFQLNAQEEDSSSDMDSSSSDTGPSSLDGSVIVDAEDVEEGEDPVYPDDM